MRIAMTIDNVHSNGWTSAVALTHFHGYVNGHWKWSLKCAHYQWAFFFYQWAFFFYQWALQWWSVFISLIYSSERYQCGSVWVWGRISMMESLLGYVCFRHPLPCTFPWPLVMPIKFSPPPLTFQPQTVKPKQYQGHGTCIRGMASTKYRPLTRTLIFEAHCNAIRMGA